MSGTLEQVFGETEDLESLENLLESDFNVYSRRGPFRPYDSNGIMIYTMEDRSGSYLAVAIEYDEVLGRIEDVRRYNSRSQALEEEIRDPVKDRVVLGT